ncbi:mucin-15 [Arapaima gigas]
MICYHTGRHCSLAAAFLTTLTPHLFRNGKNQKHHGSELHSNPVPVLTAGPDNSSLPVLSSDTNNTDVEYPSSDDTGVNNTDVEYPSHEDTSVNNTAVEYPSSDDTGVNSTAVEYPSHEDTGVNNTAVEYPSSNDTSVNNTAVENPSSNGTGVNNTTVGNSVNDEKDANRATGEQSNDDIGVNNTATEKPSTDGTGTTAASTSPYLPDITGPSIQSNTTKSDSPLPGTSVEQWDISNNLVRSENEGTGLTGDTLRTTNNKAWAAIIGTAIVVGCVGFILFLLLKRRDRRDFLHRKLEEDINGEPVLRLDNFEPLRMGHMAYDNPGLQGDSIQMDSIHTGGKHRQY